MTGRTVGAMSTADRQAWEAARTLADLGELTAQWLEGAIASQPAYTPGCGPDPETAPLIPVLACCNRAGYVTNGSQPGEAGTGYDGALVGTARRSRGVRVPRGGRADLGGGRTGRADRDRPRARHAAPVPHPLRPGRGRHPARGARPYTRFGAQLSRRHLRDAVDRATASATPAP